MEYRGSFFCGVSMKRHIPEITEFVLNHERTDIIPYNPITTAFCIQLQDAVFISKTDINAVPVAAFLYLFQSGQIPQKG